MDQKDAIISAIRTVIDPHTGLNVYDMGLISELEDGGESVRLTFIPTSPFCPLGVQLAKSIREAVLMVEGVKNCHVKVTGHIKADEINRAVNA
jgi:metal-sulfur cluster biosynthetic enzyme